MVHRKEYGTVNVTLGVELSAQAKAYAAQSEHENLSRLVRWLLRKHLAEVKENGK